MSPFLQRQIRYVRQRIGSRVVLLLRGPEPRHQPDRNIWHLYQDILWMGLAGAAAGDLKDACEPIAVAAEVDRLLGEVDRIFDACTQWTAQLFRGLAL